MSDDETIYPRFEIRDNRHRTDIMDPERHEIMLHWSCGQAGVWAVDDVRLLQLWDEVTTRLLAIGAASYNRLGESLAVLASDHGTFADRVQARKDVTDGPTAQYRAEVKSGRIRELSEVPSEEIGHHRHTAARDAGIWEAGGTQE